MAIIELKAESLKHNYNFLNNLFERNKISWGVVSKLLCGNAHFLKLLISMGIKEIHDSRISNLKNVKKINADIQTVYIKPPAKRSVNSVVKYADVSFNTEYTTIKLISNAAKALNKNHKIIIMIEMGDLREGVMGDELIDFYQCVFQLPNIEIIGLGTNLNCLNGVMPTHDKLIQLSLYKQLIEFKFNKKIPWISGGSSATIPMLFKKLVPVGINHFRIGETLYMGNNLITGKQIPGMKSDIFMLKAEIIELTEKPIVPMGQIGTNVAHTEIVVNESDYGKKSYRAIVDIGLLDINQQNMKPFDASLKISGASSDMFVIDLGRNRKHYKVGDTISFKLDYMGVLSIMNSKYIEKVIV